MFFVFWLCRLGWGIPCAKQLVKPFAARGRPSPFHIEALSYWRLVNLSMLGIDDANGARQNDLVDPCRGRQAGSSFHVRQRPERLQLEEAGHR
jgi:hypothetical protein